MVPALRKPNAAVLLALGARLTKGDTLYELGRFLFRAVLDSQDTRRTRRLTRRGAWAANVAFIRACQPLPVAR